MTDTNIKHCVTCSCASVERVTIARRILDGGGTVKHVAAQLGVSLRTAQRYQLAASRNRPANGDK